MVNRMAEYIAREALIKSAGIFEAQACARGYGRSILHLAKAWLLNEVNKAPTADVVEVVHGEWLKSEGDCWWEGSEARFCSCCGQGINVECVHWFKFCTNCGAKMDGGNNT